MNEKQLKNFYKLVSTADDSCIRNALGMDCNINDDKPTFNEFMENLDSNYVPDSSPWNKGLTGVQEAWSKGLTKNTHPSLLKISEKMKGKTPWNAGKTLSDLDKLNKSKAAKAYHLANPGIRNGRTRSQSAIDSTSKSYTLLNPNGEVITIVNMSKFCRENNLKSSCMYNLKAGRLKSYKGFRTLD